jgi:hypothetical protein
MIGAGKPQMLRKTGADHTGAASEAQRLALLTAGRPARTT